VAPGLEHEVIWNDRQGSRFVSHILDVRTRKRRTLPAPVYAVVSVRAVGGVDRLQPLQECRPGYGYAGETTFRGTPRSGNFRIWRLDLKTGDLKLIVTLAQVVNASKKAEDRTLAKHWFNHLLFSPGGQRFIFLHRWVHPTPGTSPSRYLYTSGASRGTRMYTRIWKANNCAASPACPT